MNLHFNTPLLIPTHFDVPADLTPWNPPEHHKTSTGWTPVRQRATFGTWGKSLLPITPDSQALEEYFGIYLVAADLPTPTLYVGIASNDSKASEGVLTRVKKHRVKATGSHVGSSPTSTGGVHHPENWRSFSNSRYIHLRGSADQLDDVRIVVAKFKGKELQTKADLERFESSIIANQNGILEQIVEKLWPGLGLDKITLLNGTKGGFELSPNDQVVVW